MHLKLTIQYDGTDFSGSQLQAAGRGRTVQGELEKALTRLADQPVRVALAGRTDTGVHALGQVASLDLPPKFDSAGLPAVQRSINALLPEDVTVSNVAQAPEGFHARFSARRRAYRYLLWQGPSISPLLRRYCLLIRRELNVEAMSSAVRLLEGTHDLAAFAGQGMGIPSAEDTESESASSKPSTVRTVHTARLLELDATCHPWASQAPGMRRGIEQEAVEGKLLAVDLVANAFLPQMIRTIIGTLLEVGYGKLQLDNMREILESRDRRLAGPTARPQGLCLLWVEY